MKLNKEEQSMLNGEHGKAIQKAMQILTTLGKIYGANQLLPVSSVQISGVSYDNLGEAGLDFLTEMANEGGQACVLTTLNPAGMDLENWQVLSIDKEFADKQKRVIEAFAKMGIITTCTCTPYLSGNLPHFGEHIAWAESSAVCFANSIIGARTNREGGPSALASALTGKTPNYGFHITNNRIPDVSISVDASIKETSDFGALGQVIGALLEHENKKLIPYITGIKEASLEGLKSLCASIATYGGAALFHIEEITPEANIFKRPERKLAITQKDIDHAYELLNEPNPDNVDFVSLGCPHLTIHELARIAKLLRDKKVTKEFWITTSRPTKQIADMMGYTQIIEQSGAKIAADTCCVVAPIQGRFTVMATDSAKACYYAYAKNKFKTIFKPFDEVVLEATK